MMSYGSLLAVYALALLSRILWDASIEPLRLSPNFTWQQRKDWQHHD